MRPLLFPLFLAVALSSCLNAQAESPKAGGVDCTALEPRIEKLLADRNVSCTQASDCVVLDLPPTCPFGCHLFANRSYVGSQELDALREAMALWRSHCPACKYKCLPTPKPDEIVCTEGRCARKKWE